jgi:hypothetical protein
MRGFKVKFLHYGKYYNDYYYLCRNKNIIYYKLKEYGKEMQLKKGNGYYYLFRFSIYKD